MYSYQHRYHAGGISDVHKHLVMIAILSALQKKETPIGILDLHAGEGLYDIHAPESQKTTEFKHGFRKLIGVENPPPLVQTYLEVINKYNPSTSKHMYPGSPGIAAHFLRENDRLMCVEKHPQAITELKKHFKHWAQIHERDSFEAIKALTPFKEKRGLILVDPSYEVKTEYKAIAKAVNESFERFAQGTYAIWYPILKENHHIQLLTGLQRSSLTKVWYCEWSGFNDNPESGLQGTGMVIINMPYQQDKLLKETFSWLDKHVYKGYVFKQGWI